jgi:myo-inositol-1(or 4)-monophosphatase
MKLGILCETDVSSAVHREDFLPFDLVPLKRTSAMNDEDLAVRFQFATALIREAGALAAGYFSNISSLTVEQKGPQDMVSDADRETESLIRRRIKDAFPDDAFIGEESGLDQVSGAASVWVVDPIDGTQPFVSGLPNWCVCIAFVVNSSIEIGCVFDPVSKELFSARKGFGARLNERPIRCHPGVSIKDGVVSVGYSMRVRPSAVLHILQQLLEGGGKFHRNGSAALSLCYVGCGRLLGFIEPHLNSWDCLAALLIISEAGGKHNDFLSGDGLLKGNFVVAGPAPIYDALLRFMPISTPSTNPQR